MAGREREQQLVRNRLDWLRTGAGPRGMLIFFGPRGNGKTALLTWIESEARDREIGVVDLTATEIESESALVNRLSPPRRLGDRLSEVSVRGIKWVLRQRGRDSLESALNRRLRNGPLLLSVDEAHLLDLATGRAFLPIAQKLCRRGEPFLLVLAGTPNLPDRLSAMEASFWERSTVLPLRRLDRQSSGDAIRIPFEAIGNAIEPEALAAVAEDSHGYPFFLQLWGVALWERIRGSGRPLTVEDVDRSRARFEETRNSFYEFRYRELLKSRLLFEAVALSDAFRDSEEVPDSTIRSALAADMRRRGTVPSDEAVGRALDALHGLGYVWVPGGGPVGGIYRAGIPSLMEFVVRTAAHGESFQTPTADRPSRVGSATAAIHRDGE